MLRSSPPARLKIPFASRGNRRERRSADIRQRLFRAALHLFAQRGYQKTTVEDITETADVGKGTFFNYFPTKQHVLATYGEERVAVIERALEKAKAVRKPVLPILKELVTNLAGQSSQSSELLRSIFAAHLSNASILADLQKRQRRARRLMGEMFTLARNSGEVRRDISAAELGRLTHVVFMGLTIAWSFNPDSVLQKTAEEVWNLLSPSFVISKTRVARNNPRRAKP